MVAGCMSYVLSRWYILSTTMATLILPIGELLCAESRWEMGGEK